MFGKIKGFFKGEQTELVVDKSGSPTKTDLLLSVAVLLFEMAGSDASIAQEEAQAICDVLQNQFDLEEEEIPELIETAVILRQEEGKIDQFVKVINENFGVKQRQRIFAMIWEVVEADGTVDKFEQRFAMQMKNRLRLSDEEAEEARQMEV
jgi:uncharacterized tellurite resistance protein B-like protein